MPAPAPRTPADRARATLMARGFTCIAPDTFRHARKGRIIEIEASGSGNAYRIYDRPRIELVPKGSRDERDAELGRV